MTLSDQALSSSPPAANPAGDLTTTPPVNPGRGNLRAAILAVLAFSICSLAAALRSGGFLESDGGTHFIFARHAFHQHFYFVDVWGRPLVTVLFAGPAVLGGLIGVRVTSLLMAIGCAGVAYRIAQRQGYHWPALALIFTLGSPLVFLHSFAELTELPFALIIGLAMLAYQSRRWGAMALLLAIAPLARPEGFAFLLLGMIALLAHRQFGWLLVLPLGLAAWSWAGHQIVGPLEDPWWRWLAEHWPYESGSEYPRGALYRFVIRLPMLVGPFALPAMFIGMWLNLQNNPARSSPASPSLGTPGEGRGGGSFTATRPQHPHPNPPPEYQGRGQCDHRRRVDWLIAALPLAVLAGHSVLHWLGKLSSNGEMRYLLVVAPLWGLLCARGWEWVFARMKWTRILSWAALAAVTPGLVNFAWRVLPVEPTQSWQSAQRVAAWYQGARALQRQYPRVMSNHPGIFYFLDISPADRGYVEPWSAASIDHPPAGLMLFWDSRFCLENADARYVVPLQRVKDAGWILDRAAELKCQFESHQSSDDEWHIFRSPVDLEEKKISPPANGYIR